MKRNLLAILVLGLAACAAPQTNSSLTEKTEGFNANCFTELNPAGSVRGGKFEGVHFYNGNCAMNTRALNKLSMQNNVLVIRGSDRVKSALYLDGTSVSVKVDSEMIKIGSIESGKKLELDQQITFDLMVFDKNGNAKAWKFGDNATYSKEEIAVFL